VRGNAQPLLLPLRRTCSLQYSNHTELSTKHAIACVQCRLLLGSQGCRLQIVQVLSQGWATQSRTLRCMTQSPGPQTESADSIEGAPTCTGAPGAAFLPHLKATPAHHQVHLLKDSAPYLHAMHGVRRPGQGICYCYGADRPLRAAC
jgi:hypothetical protein